MARQSAGFRSRFGVGVGAHNLHVLARGSKFEALSAEGSTLDRLNIHFGCIDELHAHKTRTVYDVVETGTGKRDNSLLWVITTAGSNRSGSCYEIRSFVTRLLDGVLADNSQFGIVYGLDDDDWTPSGAQGQRLQPDRGQPPRRDPRTDAGPPGPDPHRTDAVR